MNVATASADDLKDLLQLLHDYQEEGEEYETASDKDNTAYLEDILHDDSVGTIFIGRTSSNAPVGFCIVYLMPSSREATRIPHLLDLYVKPAMREKGFGRQLFDHAIRWARDEDFNRIVCTVENMNMAAQYLFEPYEPYSAGWVHYSLDFDKLD